MSSISFKSTPIPLTYKSSNQGVGEQNEFTLETVCPLTCETTQEMRTEAAQRAQPHLLALFFDKIPDSEEVPCVSLFDGKALYNYRIAKGRLENPLTRRTAEKVFYCYNAAFHKENEYHFIGAEKNPMVQKFMDILANTEMKEADENLGAAEKAELIVAMNEAKVKKTVALNERLKLAKGIGEFIFWAKLLPKETESQENSKNLMLKMAAAISKTACADWEKGIQELTQAFPNSAVVSAAAGCVYHTAQDFSKAATYFETSLQTVDAQLPLVDYVKGKLAHALWKQGKHKEAEAVALDVYKRSSSNVDAISVLAECCNAKGDLDSAAKYYEELYKLKPSAATARELGTIHHKQEKHKKAVDWYNTWHSSVKPTREDLPQLKYWIQSCFKLEQPKQAKVASDAAVACTLADQKPDTQILMNHLNVLLAFFRTPKELRAQDVSEARLFCQNPAVAALESELLQALSILALAYSGDEKGAIALCDQALEKRPRSANLHLQRARLCIDQGLSTEAVKACGTALTLAPGNKALPAAVQEVLAAVTKLGEGVQSKIFRIAQ